MMMSSAALFPTPIASFYVLMTEKSLKEFRMLQLFLHSLETRCSQWNLKINPLKSSCITFSL
jgi:hypothetical protein